MLQACTQRPNGGVERGRERAESLASHGNAVAEAFAANSFPTSDDSKYLNAEQEIAARLQASALEVEELEALGKTVHEDNSGDAGLTTEVSL